VYVVIPVTGSRSILKKIRSEEDKDYEAKLVRDERKYWKVEKLLRFYNGDKSIQSPSFSMAKTSIECQYYPENWSYRTV